MAGEEPRLTGQILPVPAASRTILKKGSRSLAESRGLLFRSWVKQSAGLRRPLRKTSDEIVRLINTLPRTKDGKRLLATSLRRVDRAINRGVVEAFNVIEREVRSGATQAISRSSRVQVNQLKKLGIEPPSPSELRNLRAEVLAELDKPFPADQGLNFRNRLARIERKQIARMKEIARSPVKIAGPNAREGLTKIARGTTRTAGGSAFKQARRILIAEETRLANQIEVAVLRAAGVNLAYWRLNPSHKWYGGQEICEHLASRVLPDVANLVSRSGSTAVLAGLNRVSRYPSFPHPFCKCYPEPFVLGPRRKQ